jgi:hypothetical protein
MLVDEPHCVRVCELVKGEALVGDSNPLVFLFYLLVNGHSDFAYL